MTDFLTRDEIESYLRKALAERGLESDELVEHIGAALCGDIRRSNEFDCPTCGERLQLSVNLLVRRVIALSTGEHWAKTTEMKEKFEERRRSAIEQDDRIRALKGSGLYDAFVSAMKQLPGRDQIKESTLDAHLLTFLDKSNEMQLPDWAKVQLMRTLNGTRIQAFSLSTVSAVVVDGVTRIFVPTALLKGETISRLTTSGAEIVSTSERRTLSTWIRTKHGYVVGNGAMWDEMRKKSKGDFANTGI